MKKLVAILTVLLLVGSGAGICASGTVDTFLDNRSKSELHPVSDAGTLVGTVYTPVGEVKDKVLKPFEPVTKPIKEVAHKIVNTTYDLLTFRQYREKK